MLPAYLLYLLVQHSSAARELVDLVHPDDAADADAARDPERALEALVAARSHRSAIERAEGHLLGALVLAGLPRTRLAQALGFRPGTLAAIIDDTAADWAQRPLHRDPEAFGGWRP